MATPIVFLDIAGPELAAIYDVALSAYRRTQEVFDNPRIRANPSTLSLSQPLIELRPDWLRAAELGLSAADIGFAISALTDGAIVDEFLLNDEIERVASNDVEHKKHTTARPFNPAQCRRSVTDARGSVLRRRALHGISLMRLPALSSHRISEYCHRQ